MKRTELRYEVHARQVVLHFSSVLSLWTQSSVSLLCEPYRPKQTFHLLFTGLLAGIINYNAYAYIDKSSSYTADIFASLLLFIIIN